MNFLEWAFVIKATWQYQQPARERLSPSCHDNDNDAGFDGSQHLERGFSFVSDRNAQAILRPIFLGKERSMLESAKYSISVCLASL